MSRPQTTGPKPPHLKAIAGGVTTIGVVVVVGGIVGDAVIPVFDLQPWAFTHGIAWLLIVVLFQVILGPLTFISIIVWIGEKAGDLVERMWKTKGAETNG